MTKKSVMIGFKATPQLKEALDEIAKKEDRTLSYIINRALEAYVETLKSTKE